MKTEYIIVKSYNAPSDLARFVAEVQAEINSGSTPLGGVAVVPAGAKNLFVQALIRTVPEPTQAPKVNK